MLVKRIFFLYDFPTSKSWNKTVKNNITSVILSHHFWSGSRAKRLFCCHFSFTATDGQGLHVYCTKIAQRSGVEGEIISKNTPWKWWPRVCCKRHSPAITTKRKSKSNSPRDHHFAQNTKQVKELFVVSSSLWTQVQRSANCTTLASQMFPQPLEIFRH